MKLDSEWISKAAARTVDAEDALTGDGVFTHRARRSSGGTEAPIRRKPRRHATADADGEQ